MRAAAVVFPNVLLMLAYMLCGFVLVKCRLAVSDHAKSLSGILIYVCSPCLHISSWQSLSPAPENLGKMAMFFAVSLIVQSLFFGVLFLCFRSRFHRNRYRILTAAGVLGNVGFFGLPVVQALFPGEPIVACYAAVFGFSMNLLAFTVGVYAITYDKKYISLREALINPITVAYIIAITLYVLNITLPPVVGSAVSLLGKMTTPLCMFVLGLRLASMDLRKLFSAPFSYAAVAVKLIACPLFAFLCVWWLPFLDETFKTTLFVLSAAPAASIVLALAELHETERKLSADVVLLTTICCVVTMPLLCAILL